MCVWVCVCVCVCLCVCVCVCSPSVFADCWLNEINLCSYEMHAQISKILDDAGHSITFNEGNVTRIRGDVAYWKVMPIDYITDPRNTVASAVSEGVLRSISSDILYTSSISSRTTYL